MCKGARVTFKFMKITPNLIASIVKGRVVGDGDREITGFAKIEEATEGQITFLANPKYSDYLYTTKASAVLVNEGLELLKPVEATLIYVENAYSSLAELLTAFEATKPVPEGVEQPSYVSEGVELPEGVYLGAFSYIGKNVKLGKNVRIYPQVYVGDNVTIGDNTVIKAGVKIYDGCKIGNRCILHSGCVIGADGFGFAPKGDVYEKIPQLGIVVIEDDVEIGANTTIDRATFGQTLIKQGTKLDNLIQIAHNVELGRNNVIAAQAGVAGSAKIGDNNQIGGQVGVAGHLKIGDRNQIGAQAGIPKSVGDGNRLIGYPAVDLKDFAKSIVHIKNLSGLYDRVRKLEKLTNPGE